MNTAGILNVDKPSGWTSFRVVSLVRRLSQMRRVGHAGTLDPLATGVLLILLGQAVRISQYLMDLPKTYRGEIALGTATDTYDALGRPIREGDASRIGEGQVREVLSQFLGEIQQVPPPYSALKRGGRPAYRYARAGRQVALEPRPTVIYRVDLLKFEPPLLSVEVECARGTYIRSLAHDLGLRLGCGAHLKSLRRLQIGPFQVEAACPIAAMEEAFVQGRWQALLKPLDFGLSHLPRVALGRLAETEVRRGIALAADSAPFQELAEAADGQACRAYGEDGNLVAVLRLQAARGLWRPEKVFAAAASATATD